MDRLFVKMQDILGDSEFASAKEKRVRVLAIMSVSLHKFITIVCDNLKNSEFSGLDFLVNLELFLRSVTPFYSRDKFESLMHTLKEVEERIEETDFHFALCCLREMICQDMGREKGRNILTKFEK